MSTRYAQSGVPTQPHPTSHYTAAVFAGVCGAFIGAVVGLVIGANIGGNWFTSFSIGSLHGYEATGTLGLFLGGIVVGVLAFWIVRRRSAR